MEFNKNDRVIAFDTLFTTNQIQKLKIVMPFLDNQMQKKMAVYIKFSELQYAISYCNNRPYQLCGSGVKEEAPDFMSLCTALLPFSDAEEKKQLEQFIGMFNSMEMVKEYSQTFEMMKDFMPDMNASGGGDEKNNNDGMMDMLLNMLSPEQKQMFEMFGGNDESS